ncbi:expressed unknown protein [Seminavis robusta]|uniref:Uncharacterized protein n=1 Tax=Seminavis robusta TaxID=568900 RepID=A0A9N8HLD4_9STRA|nr:expressed unknown protein [Seminavis robusta]|eukprot:Sro813_g206170.1 n/a (270) ;mRNA; f:17490-18399
MTAEDPEAEMADSSDQGGGDMDASADHDGDGDGKKKKRSKPRRQSGTAVAFQKRTSVRKLPERTTSSHLVERKGKNQLAALTPPNRQDRRGSQGAIKAATSALRAARGVPASRGVSRASSSQQAPRRPDRAVAPGKKTVPARSSSTHALKATKKGAGQEPTLTGADLLNLRKAQKADNTDADSVQSDLESTYTMDSINLRKSQIHRDDDEDLARQLRDAGLDDDYENDGSDSVSTLQSTEDGIMTDFEALADVEVEDEGQGEVVIDDDK